MSDWKCKENKPICVGMMQTHAMRRCCLYTYAVSAIIRSKEKTWRIWEHYRMRIPVSF